MDEPIKAGDVCLVVDAIGQHKSPNTGKTVRVVSFHGEHSRFGRIWRCVGKDIMQLNNNGEYMNTGWADFAQAWLQKIKPEPEKLHQETEESLTA